MSEEKNKETLNKKEEGTPTNSGKTKVEDVSTKQTTSENSKNKVELVNAKSTSNVSEKKSSKIDKKASSDKLSESDNLPEKKDVPPVSKVVPSDNADKKSLSIGKSKPREQNTKPVKRNSKSDNQNKNSENNQNEYLEKLVSINRVAKVVKGGRRFSFAALVVVGDGNGMVGHGKGKAKEVPEAIKKATDEAKNSMIRVPLRQGRTLHHDIKGRFDSGKVYLRSAPSGTGVIAGGPMRAVFEALGIQDIVAKSVGSSNPHNMVRATFEALKVVSSPKIIASRRGLKINDITKRRKISMGITENEKN